MSKADKREEIVRASLELMAEQGFHGAPMALIAERAGVGTGTIYRYFESRDTLINELYLGLEEQVYRYAQQEYPAEAPIRDRFLHLVMALLRYFIDNPLDFRYLEQFHNSPYGVVVRRDRIFGEKDRRNIYRELFEEAAARQVLKELPLVLLFALTFGPLKAVARDHILGFIALDDALIARTAEACWDSVKR
jgi:AcrR family transcriptional regulator